MLLTELKDLKSKQRWDLFWTIFWVVIFAGSIYAKSHDLKNIPDWLCIIGIIVSLLGLMVKSNDISKRKKNQEYYFLLSVIDDDIFLDEIKGLNLEEKALKQLTKKQAELEKYHSLNLTHTKSIFVIGVIIIFIGIIIIGVTIISAFLNEGTVEIIVIASGFIGGLLVDSIGAIFILMYSKTIEAANEYQASMAETANTYLGNVLVSQIKNEVLREETLASMAQELVVREKRDIKQE
ncbi:hypothetical protein C818_00985 [Lachnospiraceae bacterium MD308]|jgi:hypothetical protein|nr:hypothetical protein C818_00985 [Lachnospiraceae bacterium MD308]